MLLSTRDPEFWTKFREEHWLPRVPTVIRQPFKQFPISEELFLRTLQKFEDDLQKGDKRKHCIVSVGEQIKGDPRKPLRRLFKKPSATIEELSASVGRVFKKRNFGVIVTNSHSAHPEVWDAMTAFLQDARGTIDFPLPRTFMDLFYGRYSNKFTGLHKDTQDIFAFVSVGQKRMLAWPFEYLVGKVPGITLGDKYFNKRLPIDYRKFRKDAVVLDANAGDVIYWPGDHWHVAEPVAGCFSGMMSLGVLRQDLRRPAPEPSRFLKKLLTPNPNPGQRGAMLSQDLTSVVGWQDAERQLRWLTGFGFEHGRPMTEVPRGKSKPIRGVRNPYALVLWVRNAEHRQLVVSSGGHAITLADSPELVALLEQVARGEKVDVAEQASRVAVLQVEESYWTLESQAKIRKVGSKRDPVWWLAGWLQRVGAILPV